MTVDVRSERRLFLGKCLWEELGAKSGSDGVARPRVVVESYEVGLWNFESTVGSPVGRLSKVIRNRKHGTRAEGGRVKKKSNSKINQVERLFWSGWLVGWSGEID